MRRSKAPRQSGTASAVSLILIGAGALFVVVAWLAGAATKSTPRELLPRAHSAQVGYPLS